MKNILVPTDFSKYAAYALDVAFQIAKVSDSEIHLLHILETPTTQSFNTMGIINFDIREDIYYIELKREVTEKINKIANDEKYRDIKIVPEVEIGKTYEHITDHIAKHNADLVVMGTRGCSGLEEILIGSNTEKVVRFTKCPVLSVPVRFSTEELNTMVYATNLSNDESDIVISISLLQKVLNLKLYLIHVNTIHTIENEHDILQKLREFALNAGLENYDVYVTKAVSAEEGIMLFAEQHGANIIALSTHGRSGLAHFFSGSLAENIVNHSQKMVLTQTLDR